MYNGLILAGALAGSIYSAGFAGKQPVLPAIENYTIPGNATVDFDTYPVSTGYSREGLENILANNGIHTQQEQDRIIDSFGLQYIPHENFSRNFADLKFSTSPYGVAEGPNMPNPPRRSDLISYYPFEQNTAEMYILNIPLEEVTLNDILQAQRTQRAYHIIPVDPQGEPTVPDKHLNDYNDLYNALEGPRVELTAHQREMKSIKYSSYRGIFPDGSVREMNYGHNTTIAVVTEDGYYALRIDGHSPLGQNQDWYTDVSLKRFENNHFN